MDNFNKEAFIEEVEKRPVIWNTECPEYSDRILKKKAWSELTDLFADPSFSKEKKSILSMILQRKWKNLKDTYMKEHKKIRSNPSSSNQKGSNYMYYSKLSFLQKCLQVKSVPSPVPVSNDSQSMEVDPTVKATELLASMNDSIAELMETASSLEKSTNRLKSNEPHSSAASSRIPTLEFNKAPSKRHSLILDRQKEAMRQYTEYLTESKRKTSSKHHGDDDKLFCLSLYKEIRKVPENNRLAVKIELLNVLQRAQMSPMNEIRVPYQHTVVGASSPGVWLSANVPKPHSIGDSTLLSMPSEQSITSMAAYLKDLRNMQDLTDFKTGQSTSKISVPQFQGQGANFNMNSPVSSLESSLSSNCSIHHYMDV